jgi:hypothetical protein
MGCEPKNYEVFEAVDCGSGSSSAQPSRACDLRLVNQAVMNGVQRKLEPIRNAQFIENIMEVIFYRLFADEKFFADLTIPKTLRHQLHDFLLAVAQ